jgi:hypothetical protein
MQKSHPNLAILAVLVPVLVFSAALIISFYSPVRTATIKPINGVTGNSLHTLRTVSVPDDSSSNVNGTYRVQPANASVQKTVYTQELQQP